MPDLKFVRDLWWLNSNVNDNVGNASSPTNSLCKAIEFSDSTYINVSSGVGTLYFRTEDIVEMPEIIYWELDADSTNMTNVKVYINDVKIIDETFGPFVSLLGTYNPTASELLNITQGRGFLNYDKVKMEITNFAFSSVSIGYLRISYNNDTGKVSSNHETLVNPTVRYAYPYSMTSTNWSGYTNLAYSSSSNGNDVNAMTEISENTSSSLDLNFNISGGNYSDPTRIQQAFLKFRFNQSGTNQPTARTDYCSAYVIPSGNTYPSMWGKGFIIHPSSSGYLVGTLPLYFTNNGQPDRYYNTATNYNNFTVKFLGIPSGTKISAAEVLLYEEPDTGFNMFLKTGSFGLSNTINMMESSNNPVSFNSVNFHNLCGVTPGSDTKYPSSDTQNIASGKNRFKSIDSSGIFNIGTWNFKPSGIVSDTGISGYLSNNSPDFWHNYFVKKISSYSTHNNAYNNSLFMKDNIINIPNISGLNGEFSLLVQVSSSGNTYNYFGNTGNVLTKYNENQEREFELNCLGNIFEFVVYNTSGQYKAFELPATVNSQILLVNEVLGGTTHTTRGFHSNGSNQFTEYGNVTTVRNRSASGNLTLFSGFYGYIHELAIANKNIGATYFSNTRHNYHEYLRGSGIYINIPKVIGAVNTDYTLLLPSAQSNNSSFSQFSLNPSGIFIDITYENFTDNPSGINFSGCYYNGQSSANNNFYFTFQKNLPSGIGSGRMYAQNFVNSHPETASGYNYDILTFYLYENLLNKYVDFKLKSISISYSGYILNPSSSSGFDMSTFAEQRVYDDFDMYQNAKIVNSGVDMYTGGSIPVNSGMDFYLNTIILPVPTGTFPMYSFGAFVERSSVNFNTSGTVPQPINSRVLLSTRSNVNTELYNNIGFFSYSQLDQNNAINFSLANQKENQLDSINFAVACDIVYNKSIEMKLINDVFSVARPLVFYQATALSGLNSSMNMVSA